MTLCLLFLSLGNAATPDLNEELEFIQNTLNGTAPYGYDRDFLDLANSATRKTPAFVKQRLVLLDQMAITAGCPSLEGTAWAGRYGRGSAGSFAVLDEAGTTGQGTYVNANGSLGVVDGLFGGAAFGDTADDWGGVAGGGTVRKFAYGLGGDDFMVGYVVVNTTRNGYVFGLQGSCPNAWSVFQEWFGSSLAPANTPPSPGNWAVSPAVPVEAVHDLVCEATVTPSDPDGDPVSVTVSWMLGGSPWSGGVSDTTFAGDTIPAPQTVAGQAWSCQAIVSDAQASGPSLPSEVVTVVAGDIVGQVHTAPLALPSGARDLRFVGVPSGTFEMGCSVGRDDVAGASCTGPLDGAGLHDVTLTGDFWMGETEVTQAHWAALAVTNPVGFIVEDDDKSVAAVSWHDAAWYANALSAVEGIEACYACAGGYAAGDSESPTCTQVAGPYSCVGYRLPTEAEWEYAARGGESYPYAGSADPLVVAWHQGNSIPGGIKEVAGLAPNGFALYDMSGNVAEWTGDWWEAPYPATPVVDPEGPLSGTSRAYRGGNHFSSPRWLPVAGRRSVSPETSSYLIGFRLSRSVP